MRLPFLRQIVSGGASDAQQDPGNSSATPVPLADRHYSGEFRVRAPPDVHRALAMRVAEQGISLNRLARTKLRS